METLGHTSQILCLNQQATCERSFSNTGRKKPLEDVTEQREFLQVLVWFWDTGRKSILKGITLLLDAVYFNTECSNGPVIFKRLVRKNAQIIFVVFYKEDV